GASPRTLPTLWNTQCVAFIPPDWRGRQSLHGKARALPGNSRLAANANRPVSRAVRLASGRQHRDWSWIVSMLLACVRTGPISCGRNNGLRRRERDSNVDVQNDASMQASLRAQADVLVPLRPGNGPHALRAG